MTSIHLNKLRFGTKTNQSTGERRLTCMYDDVEYMSDEPYSDWIHLQLLICEAYKINNHIILINGNDVIAKLEDSAHGKNNTAFAKL